MGRIVMKISTKKLGLFFLLNILSFGSLIFLAFGSSIELDLLLWFAAGASLFVTTFTGMMIYTTLPQIKVDYNGIHTGAGGSKSIFYRDIRELRVGQGALKVFSEDCSITISNFYTNYKEAAELVKKMIKGRDDVLVTRSEFPAGLKLLKDKFTEREEEVLRH